MTDIVVQLVRILLRYLAAVLVAKGVSNEPVLSLFQDETVIQTISGVIIIALTETSWISSMVKQRIKS